MSARVTRLFATYGYCCHSSVNMSTREPGVVSYIISHGTIILHGNCGSAGRIENEQPFNDMCHHNHLLEGETSSANNLNHAQHGEKEIPPRRQVMLPVSPYHVRNRAGLK